MRLRVSSNFVVDCSIYHLANKRTIICPPSLHSIRPLIPGSSSIPPPRRNSIIFDTRFTLFLPSVPATLSGAHFHPPPRSQTTEFSWIRILDKSGEQCFGQFVFCFCFLFLFLFFVFVFCFLFLFLFLLFFVFCFCSPFSSKKVKKNGEKALYPGNGSAISRRKYIEKP